MLILTLKSFPRDSNGRFPVSHAKYKLNTKENKKIGQLMKQIKESTNTYSKSEINYRNKLNKILEAKKKLNCIDNNKTNTVDNWNEIKLNLRKIKY